MEFKVNYPERARRADALPTGYRHLNAASVLEALGEHRARFTGRFLGQMRGVLERGRS